MSLDTRTKFLVYVPCATAAASLIGSSLMLLTLYRTSRQQAQADPSGLSNSRSSGSQTSRTYDRLMTGIAVSDMIMSLALVAGPLPIPKETGFPGAHGTQTTCTWQSVFLQLGTASLPYSFMLMLYFVLVIRFNVKEQTIATRVEPVLHFIPIVYHTTTTILAICWDVTNSAGTFCWIQASPLGCDDIPEMECDRGGEWARFFGDWLMMFPFTLWTILLILALFVISFTVWQKYRQSERFVFRGSRSSTNAAKQTHQVMIQCLLYAVSFANFIVWSTLGTFLYYFGKESKYWMMCLTFIFFPLQGFFNFSIFIRPRYLRKRELHASEGRWFALCEAVWNPISPQSRVQDEVTSNSIESPKDPTPPLHHPQIQMQQSSSYSDRGDSVLSNTIDESSFSVTPGGVRVPGGAV